MKQLLEKLRDRIARKKQASLQGVLRRSLFASIVFHGSLLVIAAVFVISHIFYNRESTFVGQPPPMKSYEPRKLEFKVKVSKQQRSSSRPSMAPRLVSTRTTANITMPEIKMDAKAVKTSFQPKFKAFGGTGLGSGLGGGYGLSGFGNGVSAFDFFGIRGRGDRIVILVDVSVSMVEEDKGGPKGFVRVKNRINQVIDALNEGAMFNVVVFADACSAYETKVVVATDDNKTKAKTFLRGFNTEGNYGLTSGNISPSSVAGSVIAVGGTTRLDLALTVAFEEGADTILIISDGKPEVKKGITAAQAQAYSQATQAWYQQNQGAIAAYEAQAAAFQAQAAPVTSTRVWIPPTPAVPARAPSKAPPKEGQAPDRGSPAIPAQPGHWEVRTSGGGGGGGPPRPAPPPMQDPGMWTFADFVRHFSTLQQTLYAGKGKKPPVVHCIGFAIDPEGNAFLKQLAELYHGRYRRVAKID
ncbi:MAG: vWA domain-containing protein [bacterium]